MQLRALAVLAMAIPAPVLAQDFIHYNFDSPCTTEVINLATGPSALPANGLLESTSPNSPYTAGIFGGALAAGSSVTPTFYNRVRTGWDPSAQNVTGSFTLACFLRKPAGNGTPFYIMGAPSGGIRLFTAGIAGRGLYMRQILASGGNGINATIANDFYLPASVTDFQTLAETGWVHVAIVVDATASTADWYINGVSVLQLTNVVGGASLTAAGPFTVGYYSSTSHYDTDEFLISLRAYSAAEVLALSLAPKAGDGDYRSGIAAQCGPGNVVLGSAGGPPTLGNAGYSLTIATTAPSFFGILLGFDRCMFGGAFQLPLAGGSLTPVLNGCWILADAFGTATGIVTGSATVGLAIPANNLFLGTNVFAQGAGIDLATSAISMSDGFAIGIGQ